LEALQALLIQTPPTPTGLVLRVLGRKQHKITKPYRDKKVANNVKDKSVQGFIQKE
jgi:hypothetical protein